MSWRVSESFIFVCLLFFIFFYSKFCCTFYSYFFQSLAYLRLHPLKWANKRRKHSNGWIKIYVRCCLQICDCSLSSHYLTKIFVSSVFLQKAKRENNALGSEFFMCHKIKGFRWIIAKYQFQYRRFEIIIKRWFGEIFLIENEKNTNSAEKNLN